MALRSLTPDLIMSGDRRALSRAITLIESSRADHRTQARALLDGLPKDRRALRIGLSGTPGVGKSTFIESFGIMLTAQGLRVAVLAVDPSSTVSGGSILGDKTRMDLLARDPNAFIRPSPSQAHLGGVARRTREVIALCEAAGFDVIVTETVGVGQSETMVAQMTDLFVLLLAPAGGDELQGVKRGIMEVADLILINKADGDLKPAAVRTTAEYAGALHLLRKRVEDPDGFPKARAVSALTKEGLDATWADMQHLARWRQSEGHWDTRRAQQAVHWFHTEVRTQLLARIEQSATAQSHMQALLGDVSRGVISPDQAATVLLGKI